LLITTFVSIGNIGGSLKLSKHGAAWMLDTHNGIVWHNGGTSSYNSYLGFDPDKQIAVVILSNQPPGYRIPATVMGAKLLINLKGAKK
jgi:CubicO group peptidase (beta-lactamase class C family)